MDTHNEVCPNCNNKGCVYLLSTTNEYRWYCDKCEIRFTDNKDILVMKPYESKYE